MASPSCPSTSPMKKIYDVFISFRGEDTRKNFTSHFYAALCRKKVKTYIDDDRLEKGEEISSALLRAIEESKISVVIFSENYASSSWCLTELAHIVRCKEVKKQLVVPIFYHVDPSDIHQQQNSYAVAFAKHEKRFKDEKVQQWRNALKEAGNMCGWNISVTSYTESEVVEEIVKDILKRLDDMSSKADFKDLVGIDKQVQNIERLLHFSLLDVRIVGIWGMGGIGKTTLAEVIFSRFADPQFESCCFLRNIKDTKRHKLHKLQKKLFSKLLKEKIENVNQFVMNRLQRTKVLVVLDDVDDFEQLEYLVRDRSCYGCGSRIIITSRDKQVLNNIQADGIYEVDELNSHDALQLFYVSAFKGNSPTPVYLEMSKNVVAKYAKGVPSEEKNIFLDIAFFFVGTEQDAAKRILDSYCLGVAMGIRVLIDKCLVTADHSNRLSMHDLVQDMGIEIVRQQSPDEPGKRSRLRSTEDVCNVLKTNAGTPGIHGIFLDLSKASDVICLRSEVFKTMYNLKLLKLQDHCGESKLHFRKGLKYLPNELRYLHWENCSLKILPRKFCPQNLVELHLNNNKLNQLWDGVQHVESLKLLNLKESENLSEVPDLSWALNLEEIELSGCTRLKHLPSSTGKLESLQFLNLFGCSNFDEFPELPENITYLGMAETAIENVPPSIEHLSHLRVFNLGYCKRLKSLPSNFFKLKSLRELYIKGCVGLKYLPEVLEPMESLIVLQTQETGITRLPLSIEKLVRIKDLEMQYTGVSEISDWLFSLPALESLNLCKTNISRIPESIKLSKLRCLYIRDCKLLQSLPELPLSMRKVDAGGCTALETISNSWSLLAQGPKGVPSILERFSFEGCLKLDLKNILIEFQIRALYVASVLFLLKVKGWLKLANEGIVTELHVARLRASILQQEVHRPERDLAFFEVTVCRTGDEIPGWFSYKNVGCSININLSPLWYSPNNFMGFAFCCVVNNSYDEDIAGLVNLNWEIYLKTNYNHVRHLKFVTASRWLESHHISDQVFMASYLDIGAIDFDSVIEMSFHFSFDDPLKRKIKRCGIRILSLQDAIEFAIIGSQYELGESNVVTNKLQPSGFWKHVLYPLLGFQVFPSRQELCEKVLSSKMQQRHKELWLLLVWDCFPVREVVSRQMDVADTTCPLCGMVLESATHLFLYCTSVRPLWFMSRWGLRTDFLLCDSMASFLHLVLFGDPNSDTHQFDREFLHYASVLMDAIWLARNELVHKENAFHIADIHSSVQAQFNHLY